MKRVWDQHACFIFSNQAKTRIIKKKKKLYVMVIKMFVT